MEVLKSIILSISYAIFFVAILICGRVLGVLDASIIMIGSFSAILCGRCFHTIYCTQALEDGFFSTVLKGLSWILAVLGFGATLFFSFISNISASEMTMFEWIFSVFWPVCIVMILSMYQEREFNSSLPYIALTILPVSAIFTFVISIPFAYLYTINWINESMFFKFVLIILYYLLAGGAAYFAGTFVIFDDNFPFVGNHSRRFSYGDKGLYKSAPVFTVGNSKGVNITENSKGVNITDNSQNVNNAAVLEDVDNAVFRWSNHVGYSLNGYYSIYDYKVEYESPAFGLHHEIRGRSSHLSKVNIIVSGGLIITVYDEYALNHLDDISEQVNNDLLKSLNSTVKEAINNSRYETNQEYVLSCNIDYKFILEN